MKGLWRVSHSPLQEIAASKRRVDVLRERRRACEANGEGALLEGNCLMKVNYLVEAMLVMEAKSWRLGGGAQSGNRFRFRLRCVRVRACEAVCGREADVYFGARASEPKIVGLRSGPGRAGPSRPAGC